MYMCIYLAGRQQVLLLSVVSGKCCTRWDGNKNRVFQLLLWQFCSSNQLFKHVRKEEGEEKIHTLATCKC